MEQIAVNKDGTKSKKNRKAFKDKSATNKDIVNSRVHKSVAKTEPLQNFQKPKVSNAVVDLLILFNRKECCTMCKYMMHQNYFDRRLIKHLHLNTLFPGGYGHILLTSIWNDDNVCDACVVMQITASVIFSSTYINDRGVSLHTEIIEMSYIWQNVRSSSNPDSTAKDRIRLVAHWMSRANMDPQTVDEWVLAKSTKDGFMGIKFKTRNICDIYLFGTMYAEIKRLRDEHAGADVKNRIFECRLDLGDMINIRRNITDDMIYSALRYQVKDPAYDNIAANCNDYDCSYYCTRVLCPDVILIIISSDDSSKVLITDCVNI